MHRAYMYQCQTAINQLLHNPDAFWAGPGCTQVIKEVDCALSICNEGKIGYNVPWRSMAVAGQDILASCRAGFDQGTAGSVNTLGLSDEKRDVEFTVILGNPATMDMERRAIPKTSGAERRREAAEAVEAKRAIATARDDETAAVVTRDDNPRREIRPGLELEVVTEQGGRYELDRRTAEDLEDHFLDNWRRGGAAGTVNDRRFNQDTQYSLIYAPTAGDDVLNIDPRDRFNLLQGMQNFRHDRGDPRLFVARVWSGAHVLGWLAWDIAPQERLMF
ncbi:hypothetical protein BJ166DRAFT_529978 [Pestalotiopsis sp. NC0098]|nr:hypothetical protein BJ166DRAFT_529978 [Pestalotiopsis sp. NC0098]